MEMSLNDGVIVIAGLLCALQAGLMYDFNVDIVPSVRSISPKAHIEMMQAINDKIKNPWFFLSFFGAAIMLALATYLHRGTGEFFWLALATGIYSAGNIGVTAIGNIPLNDRLAEHDPARLTEVEAEAHRSAYQGPGSPWMRWHAIRTVSTLVATCLVFLVCLAK